MTPRRVVVVSVAVVAALVLAACSGKTTGASNVSQSAAQLNFTGSCGSGENCSWYTQYRKVGTSTWTQTPHRGPVAGPETNVALAEPVTGLSPSTSYEYQACGNAQPNQGFACVGPDGTSNTTSTFTTSLVASATSGPPTTSVTLSGAGFAPAEGIDLRFDSTELTIVTADRNGSFSGATVTIPASAQPGNHVLSAVGRSNGRTVQVGFTVSTDWAERGFGAGRRGFNPYENTISTANVSNLQQAFHVSTAGAQSQSPLNGPSSSPAVVNGTVYIGSTDEHLYAFPASCSGSCSPLWKGATGGQINSSPAVANGVVYVGSNDDKLYAFPTSCSGTCTPLWTGTTGGVINSSPVVANGMVYVGSNDDKLYAFSTSCSGSCSPSWTAATGGSLVSSPAVANGVVYIGSEDGNLYAFPASCSGSCSPLWPGAELVPQRVARSGRAPPRRRSSRLRRCRTTRCSSPPTRRSTHSRRRAAPAVRVAATCGPPAWPATAPRPRWPTVWCTKAR